MPRSPRTTWTHGRRCALLGASAAVVCLGAVVASCGAGDGEGYVATGAAGGPTPSSDTAVRPTGDVTLVPLQGTASRPARSPASANPVAPHGTSAGSTAVGTTRTGTTADVGGGSGGATDAPTPPTAGPGDGRSPSATPSAEGPPDPAALVWSEPVREDTDRRWCENVTLEFRNTGGSPVTSGAVTFGTHVIGALGIDWATVESTAGLPVPIDAGARREKTWTVCVDAWRVPLGMRVETRDVTVRWG
ncbi:hypothetical protein ACFUIY_27665 [Streptomyces griseorubiginosus]|uniref:hypothetical protein n=1 Tax=Streptomyces griseorubiginosus TaxID=67304 RepID=UPI0036288A53